MRSNRLWIGMACGVVLALGIVAAVDAGGTQTAGAQATVMGVTLQKPPPCNPAPRETACPGDPVLVTASSRPGSFTSFRTAGGTPQKEGDYIVDFNIPVTGCSSSASPGLGSTTNPMPLVAVTAPPPTAGTDDSKVRVYVYKIAAVDVATPSGDNVAAAREPALTDNNVSVQVVCPPPPGVTG